MAHECPDPVKITDVDTCRAVGLNLGYNIRGSGVTVGTWSWTPCGCFIVNTDDAFTIHFNSNTDCSGNASDFDRFNRYSLLRSPLSHTDFDVSI